MGGPLPTIALAPGILAPVLGQGTWRMGEDDRRRAEEISALRLGLDLGMTLIDTAEMYGDGGAEELVGEAIAGRRDEVLLVSKVLPDRASRRGTVAACEDSLTRLGTDRIDLYLLHWRGNVPLEETVDAFEALVTAGKIRAWGGSNFDVGDMDDVAACGCPATNQILYNLTRRGPECDLLPRCRTDAVSVMAYSPVEQGRMLDHPALVTIASGHDATVAQVAIAWLVRQEGVIAIPKAGSRHHVRDNRAAAELILTDQDLAELDRAFPPPDRPTPLAML